mgnify:CR=1 FL=1
MALCVDPLPSGCLGHAFPLGLLKERSYVNNVAVRTIVLVGFVTYTALNWDWFSYLFDIFTQTPDLFSSTLALGRASVPQPLVPKSSAG